MKSSFFKLALYTEEFLTPSMTFIYRQLTSLPDGWKVFVITRRSSNELLFPFANVYICKRSLKERAINIVYRLIGYRFRTLGRQSSKFHASVFANEMPDLIHAHFGPSALEMLPVAKQLNIPMITTFHGMDASKLLRSDSYRKQLKSLFSYSYILTVSEIMKKELIEFGSPIDRTKCAYIGVPVTKFKPQSRRFLVDKCRNKEEIRFLQVSNFVEKKGHKYTLLAFSKLVKNYPHVTLTLAGNGPLKQMMEHFTTELGIQNSVYFIGHKNTNEVVDLMKKADCFVHHSVTASNGDKEGIPTVLMEAMASGLPVISTIHAGIPELVQHNVNGFLVDEGDVDAYVVAMERALKDDGSIGQSARLTIEKTFNMEKQIQSLADLYGAVVNEKRNNN